MPELKPGETEQEWMERCVPDLTAEGRTQEQAVAICLSRFGRKSKEDAPNYRLSDITDSCANCLFNIDGYCELFDFNWEQGFICDAWEPMKEVKGVSEKEMHEEEKMPEFMATSFAELDEIRKAEDIMHDMQDLKADFGVLSQNIMDSPFVEDKSGALIKLAAEFGEKVQMVEENEKAKEQGEKSILETIKGWFEDLKGLIVKPLLSEEDKSQPVGFKTYLGNDGNPWIMLWTTNGFKDRELETFRTQAIKDYVDRHVEDDKKGEFWFWHYSGTKFADIKLQTVEGRFLIEAGPFDDTKMGQMFSAFFQKYPYKHPVLAPEGWGASHGFVYDSEDRKDGIYDWFEKKESSVLPAAMAANPYNEGFRLSKEGNPVMNEKVREQWEGVFGKEMVAEMIQSAETKTAELEEAGVEFKGETVEDTQPEPEETTEDTKEESVDAETENVETVEETEAPITRDEIKEVLQEIVETLRQEFKAMAQTVAEKQIEETVDGLNEILVPMAKKLQDLAKTEETKIAEQVNEIPKASRQTFVESILGSKATVVDRRTSYGKDGPEEAEEVNDELPTVKGVSLKLWK